MKAINYDLSIERYNGDTGAYSLGLFYKDTENFLFRSASSNIRDGTAGANMGPDGVTISMPNNGKWAEVYGAEMSAQQIFYGLPGALSGPGRQRERDAAAPGSRDWNLLAPGGLHPAADGDARGHRQCATVLAAQRMGSLGRLSCQSEFLEGIYRLSAGRCPTDEF